MRIQAPEASSPMQRAAKPDILLLSIVDARNPIAIARVVWFVAITKGLALAVSDANGLAVARAFDIIAVAAVSTAADVIRVPVDGKTVVAVGCEDGGVLACAAEVGAVLKGADSDFPVLADLLILPRFQAAVALLFMLAMDFSALGSDIGMDRPWLGLRLRDRELQRCQLRREQA